MLRMVSRTGCVPCYRAALSPCCRLSSIPLWPHCPLCSSLRPGLLPLYDLFKSCFSWLDTLHSATKLPHGSLLHLLLSVLTCPFLSEVCLYHPILNHHFSTALLIYHCSVSFHRVLRSAWRAEEIKGWAAGRETWWIGSWSSPACQLPKCVRHHTRHQFPHLELMCCWRDLPPGGRVLTQPNYLSKHCVGSTE